MSDYQAVFDAAYSAIRNVNASGIIREIVQQAADFSNERFQLQTAIGELNDRIRELEQPSVSKETLAAFIQEERRDNPTPSQASKNLLLSRLAERFAIEIPK